MNRAYTHLQVPQRILCPDVCERCLEVDVEEVVKQLVLRGLRGLQAREGEGGEGRVCAEDTTG